MEEELANMMVDGAEEVAKPASKPMVKNFGLRKQITLGGLSSKLNHKKVVGPVAGADGKKKSYASGGSMHKLFKSADETGVRHVKH